MKIIRSQHTWRVIETFTGESYCLEQLALEKAYRVAEVCKTLGCSSRYIHKVFVRDVGIPPKQWMKMERMVVARRKLEGGKLPEEVSIDLGFQAISNFHRQFFNCYAMTATNFLRSRRVFDPSKESNFAPISRRVRKNAALSGRKTSNGDTQDGLSS